MDNSVVVTNESEKNHKKKLSLSGEPKRKSTNLQKTSDLVQLVQILDDLQKKQITLDDALEFIASLTQAERVLLVMLSPVDGDLYVEAAAGLSIEQKKQGHYVVGEGIVGKVIQSGETIFVHDVMNNPLFLNRTHARKADETLSFLCVPIKYNEQVIGALAIDRPTQTVVDAEHEERLLSVIANSFVPYIKLYHNSMQTHSHEPLRLPKRAHRGITNIIGNSEAMQLVYERISQASKSATTVMLRGESGTGKELVARALHENSVRKEKPFITLNCAAIPENLVESELFGHEKGAFTGALQARKGRFEMADKGTLFLDEVGELSLTTQARLLRVLQERCFERVGSEISRSVDVRIITATNRPLEEMVEEGTFRKDLYYRLNVFSIHLPKLAERKSDIIPLAEYFLEQFAKSLNIGKPRFSVAASEMLERYSWPGNVRELENIIERSLLLIGNDSFILPQHLPYELHSDSCPLSNAKPHLSESKYTYATLPEQIEHIERGAITEALTLYKGHMGAAASYLGLTERIMGQRMRKYSISYKEFRKKENQ